MLDQVPDSTKNHGVDSLKVFQTEHDLLGLFSLFPSFAMEIHDDCSRSMLVIHWPMQVGIVKHCSKVHVNCLHYWEKQHNCTLLVYHSLGGLMGKSSAPIILQVKTRQRIIAASTSQRCRRAAVAFHAFKEVNQWYNCWLLSNHHGF